MAAPGVRQASRTFDSEASLSRGKRGVEAVDVAPARDGGSPEMPEMPETENLKQWWANQ